MTLPLPLWASCLLLWVAASFVVALLWARAHWHEVDGD
jgi:hypothetical protein